jgi:hypothetical protein
MIAVHDASKCKCRKCVPVVDGMRADVQPVSGGFVQRAAEAGGLKPSNPKDIIGSSKLPLHLWPETATILGALACLDGCLKYGRSNYRAIGVRSTIYIDAAKRHLNAWLEGEECASDSGIPHLGHALACIAIIIDAEAAGKLNDDRNVTGGYHDMVERWTPLVAEIKARHAGKAPKHYTIADNGKVPA